MSQFINFLSLLVSIYMMIIFFRIILTWFTGFGNSGLIDFLCKITDPYLNWFGRFTFLRVGFLDLSPIAALGVLSLLQRILGILARYGKISIGVILAVIIQGIWGAVSFLLGFLIIVLILRLITALFIQDAGGSFWNAVDTISQPVLFKIRSFLFKNRFVNFTMLLVISIAGLVMVYFGLRILFSFVSVSLARLPF